MSAQDSPIRIGISSCLLGEAVRFDTGHKLDRFIRDTVGQFVEFVSVCPEMEMGLGTPRETLRLVALGRSAADGEAQTILLAPKSQTDHSGAMAKYAKARCRDLASDDLSGYILKRASPSCGMERVKVYPTIDGGAPTKTGRGHFAEALMAAFPHLPVEEEGRLCDPLLRENFFVRVFAYRRLRELFRARWTVGQLVAFHTAEKMQLLAHHRPGYTALGKLVASAKAMPRAEVADTYTRLFLETLAHRSTRRKHTNVLQHMVGHFRDRLDDSDRAEVRDVVEAYRTELVPLIVPITLIRHFSRKHAVSYLLGQSYLDPHPRELMLRNHV